MDFGSGVAEELLPPQGGEIGPIEAEAGTVFNVEVEQDIDRGQGSSFRRWAFITGELLDENRNYLMAFGGETWHEAGYDGGSWREQDDEFYTKLTVPREGTYYLRFQSEANVPTHELGRMEVEVHQNLGSSLPHHVAAIVALFGGLALLFFSATSDT